ncbi:MAG: hypothetical protein HOY69_35545, partial [Streptomyces sp.]|nr:hypothetical protein [Streptomyces sp.]
MSQGVHAAPEFGVSAVLFDVSHSQVTAIFGKDRVATLPASAFPPASADVVNAENLVDGPVDAGEWPVIGWLLNAHLALDPVSGKVYAV